MKLDNRNPAPQGQFAAMFENLKKPTIAKLSQEQLIRSCARTVRIWTEQRDDMQPYPSGDLNGWCAIASAELYREFKRFDITCEIHMANGPYGCHVFCVVEDHVVDVTATQFNEYRETPILIMHKRLVEQYWFYTSAEVFYSDVELVQHQHRTKWTVEQIAWAERV